ncbi:MAG: ethanolamine ammonia-lyase subunit EutB [Flavobacterium psychrophilum]
MYRFTKNNISFTFPDLKTLLAKATPYRSGDALAGLVANSYTERIAAQYCLAEVPLTQFLQELPIPYEEDEVSRLIIDSHDAQAFQIIASHTVGSFRDWLLQHSTTTQELQAIKWGLTPEMVAAVSKIMRNQDLMVVAKKCINPTRFRNTLGLAGHFSSRIQPNHPADDLKGIGISLIEGLLYGCGDAVIGINPASDDPRQIAQINHLLNDLIQRFEIPTQACVLTHLTTTLQLIEQQVPVDLVFQSIGGTEKTNQSFGINLSMLQEGLEAGLSLNRGSAGNQCMYFETGQGSSLSAQAHSGVDQQTCETRAYAVARKFNPLLVNSVVGFIGPEYLYDGKQINRAALEDLFCGKLLGLPMGLDLCYTNHAEADQNDMDSILVQIAVAGCGFVMGVPGADDVMLNYQSTSYHDVQNTQRLLGLKPAPEFSSWLEQQGLATEINRSHPLIQYLK